MFLISRPDEHLEVTWKKGKKWWLDRIEIRYQNRERRLTPFSTQNLLFLSEKKFSSERNCVVFILAYSVYSAFYVTSAKNLLEEDFSTQSGSTRNYVRDSGSHLRKVINLAKKLPPINWHCVPPTKASWKSKRFPKKTVLVLNPSHNWTAYGLNINKEKYLRKTLEKIS